MGTIRIVHLNWGGVKRNEQFAKLLRKYCGYFVFEFISLYKLEVGTNHIEQKCV